VKYFSGTASYSKAFLVADDWTKPNQRVYLDLGKVAVMAQVQLNGTELGTLWKPPYRVEITKALKPGNNQLLVQVVKTWFYRRHALL